MCEILTDCDQDTLQAKVTPRGPACHTGRRSCVYRRLVESRLVFVGQKSPLAEGQSLQEFQNGLDRSNHRWIVGKNPKQPALIC